MEPHPRGLSVCLDAMTDRGQAWRECPSNASAFREIYLAKQLMALFTGFGLLSLSTPRLPELEVTGANPSCRD